MMTFLKVKPNHYKDICEGELTINECLHVLKSFECNKSKVHFLETANILNLASLTHTVDSQTQKAYWKAGER